MLVSRFDPFVPTYDVSNTRRPNCCSTVRFHVCTIASGLRLSGGIVTTLKNGFAGYSAAGTGVWIVATGGAVGPVSGFVIVRLPAVGGFNCSILMLSNCPA